MRLYLENTQERAGGVPKGVSPEFKPQYHKKTPQNFFDQKKRLEII
jgi:hypothetical protein